MCRHPLAQPNLTKWHQQGPARPGQEPRKVVRRHLSHCLTRRGWLCLELLSETPDNRASHRSCLPGEPLCSGARQAPRPRPLRLPECGEAALQSHCAKSAVITISFLEIKYLSAKTASGCEKPGPVSAQELRAVPSRDGGPATTSDTALVGLAALSLSDPARPFVLSE